ncbi:hypothetical protein BD410DRAFT_312282 [Rickenella mellea]|uniref:Uncharacterized protein n=1 Tax=Rickenella mellea TaxID=50990 RepID=A0A4Y7Q3D0_9AGAM|nr:hypothetical protein BD410DRAFT_312282 [Rickenella mellea]
MAALKELRDNLGKRMHVVRKAFARLVMENGVKTMPDEIISLIFEAGHYLTNGCKFSTLVSHVSRRFHQVALRTPLLWSRLSGWYTDIQVQTFLRRSGQVDLEVSTGILHNPTASGKVVSFLTVLLPHSG